MATVTQTPLPERPPIPHVTSRSGEEPVRSSTVVLRPDGRGVGYRDEMPGDRDRYGVLWLRTEPGDGRGRPQWRRVHPGRQREAMLGSRCQVCAGEPSRTRAGTLFFQVADPERASRWWPESEFTLHPPICLPCAGAALAYCPFVAGAQAVRVRKPRLWGVFGTGYALGPNGRPRASPEDVQCAYADGRTRRWVVAQQAITELNRCTVVDIRAELSAAGLPVPEHGGSGRS